MVQRKIFVSNGLTLLLYFARNILGLLAQTRSLFWWAQSIEDIWKCPSKLEMWDRKWQLCRSSAINNFIQPVRENYAIVFYSRTSSISYRPIRAYRVDKNRASWKCQKEHTIVQHGRFARCWRAKCLPLHETVTMRDIQKKSVHMVNFYLMSTVVKGN